MDVSDSDKLRKRKRRSMEKAGDSSKRIKSKHSTAIQPMATPASEGVAEAESAETHHAYDTADSVEAEGRKHKKANKRKNREERILRKGNSGIATAKLILPEDRMNDPAQQVNGQAATHGVAKPKKSKRKSERPKSKKMIVPKRDRSKSSKHIEEQETSEQGVTTPSKPTFGTVSAAEAYMRRRPPLWAVSTPSGGRFLPSDPIYSSDEKFLLLATQRAVKVYSTEDSLLVRSIPVGGIDSIAAIVLSSLNPDRVFVATSTGLLYSYQWLSGELIDQWKTGLTASSMACVCFEQSAQDTLILVATKQKAQRPRLVLFTIPGSPGKSLPDPSVLWNHSSIIHLAHVAITGNAIFLASGNSLFLGRRDESMRSELPDTSPTYIWSETTTNEIITSIDTVTGGGGKHTVDLAIGGAQGTIYLYHDVFGQLASRDDSGSVEAQLTYRRLKWHTDPIGAIKWSRDRNYIISGGGEAVLVLWQLETGKKETLPHLPAAIEALSVAPTGVSYALKLVDNSVVVISTSELMAKANIAGIQSRTLTQRSDVLSRASSTPKATQNTGRPTKTILTNDPKNASLLLIAVPTAQQSQQGTSAPFLQTYDAVTGRHIARQALTRNNVTNRKTGPQGNILQEPDITHMQISSDGRWLATVEQWTPPFETTLNPADPRAKETQLDEAQAEVYLKFWRWEEDLGQWVLETRIDSPHTSAYDPVINRVLDLIATPQGHGFATVGEDAIVRIWIPKTRFENGLVLRGAKAAGEALITWSCRFEVHLESHIATNEPSKDILVRQAPNSARLAYSQDGSVLAVAHERSHHASGGLVQLIAPATGDIRYTQSNMWGSGLAGLAFASSRHLVILSEDLRVWDVVVNKLAFGFSLNLPSLGRRNLRNMSMLAVNLEQNTFAIALPTADESKDRTQVRTEDMHSTVLIFKPEQPVPLLSVNLPWLTTAITPVRDSPNYFLLDANAEIRTVGPKAALRSRINMEAISATRTATSPVPPTDLAMIEAPEGENAEEVAADADMEFDDEDDAEKPVIRTGQLAKALDKGPAFALPPVKDLFSAVLGLYGRKPRPVEAV